MPSDPVMVQYQNKATGHVASCEKGSRMDRKRRADPKRFTALKSEAVKPEKAPAK